MVPLHCVELIVQGLEQVAHLFCAPSQNWLEPQELVAPQARQPSASAVQTCTCVPLH